MKLDMNQPGRAMTHWRSCMSIGCSILGISLTGGVAAGEEKENPMALTPNRPVIAEGLGRLPQFSHAMVAGELIFVSGTLGTLGEAFDIAPGGTGPQTTQTLRNIETVLRAAGADLSDVVKVSVYLADMSTFQEMNEAYSKFFPETPPARITVGGAVLALGAAVEIECIARHVP
jgi:2-iminobutanoate/2-iminopropanoate deaminase